jgi:hypothetical protein
LINDQQSTINPNAKQPLQPVGSGAGRAAFEAMHTSSVPQSWPVPARISFIGYVASMSTVVLRYFCGEVEVGRWKSSSEGCSIINFHHLYIQPGLSGVSNCHHHHHHPLAIFH